MKEKQLAYSVQAIDFIWRSLGDSNPCFRRERAKLQHLIVLASLAPACLQPLGWPARASASRALSTTFVWAGAV